MRDFCRGYCGRVVKAKDLKSFHESVAGSNPVNIVLFFGKRKETSYAHTSIDLLFACGFCQRSAHVQSYVLSARQHPHDTPTQDSPKKRTHLHNRERNRIERRRGRRRRRRRGPGLGSLSVNVVDAAGAATPAKRVAANGSDARQTAPKPPLHLATPPRAPRNATHHRKVPRAATFRVSTYFIAVSQPHTPAPPWPSTRPS